MERRKKLATAGAVSLTATAAVFALGASVGLFGLTDDNPRVGNLSPIDSVHSTTPTTPTVPATTLSTAPSGRGDGADDGPRHDVGDDSGVDSTNTPSNTTGIQSSVDDHGGDDNRGPGSSSSSSDDDSNGTGRDHPEDD